LSETDRRFDEDVAHHKPKSMFVAYLLWFFVGWLAAHRFYLRRYGWPQLVLMPIGIGGLWWFADLFLIPGMVRKSGDGTPPSDGGMAALVIVAITIGLIILSYQLDPEGFKEAIESTEERMEERRMESISKSSPEIRDVEIDSRPSVASAPEQSTASRSNGNIYAEIGEAVEGRRVSVSILKIYKSSLSISSSGEWILPKEGALFVVVDYKFTNISDGPIGYFNAPIVKLVSPSGAEFKPVEISGGDFSDLIPFLSNEGAARFEVAKQHYEQLGWELKVRLDRGEFFVRIVDQ
jgi:TM2 domain-containing protein